MDDREYERLREELARLREQVEALERSRWWRLHPRFLLRRGARPQTPVTAHEHFDPEVLAELREGAKRSAAVIAPVVQELVQAGSVIDVGGGEGWWADAFAGLGARAASVDSATAAEQAPRVKHVHRNLPDPLDDLGAFDLALCLEVAEHMETHSGDLLLDTLCSCAPVVLFSAATPGQGGHGHVNEQWPRYWAKRFEARGFLCSGALRWLFWEDERVESWYRQNLLFATSNPDRYPTLFATATAQPWAVVHPITLDRIRRPRMAEKPQPEPAG